MPAVHSSGASTFSCFTWGTAITQLEAEHWDSYIREATDLVSAPWSRAGQSWESRLRSLPGLGLLRKLQQGPAPAQDCWSPLVKTQGLCQVGAARSPYLLAASLKLGQGLVGLCTQPKGLLRKSSDEAVQEKQASFDKDGVEAILLSPQTLTQYWAAASSVKRLVTVVNWCHLTVPTLPCSMCLLTSYQTWQSTCC